MLITVRNTNAIGRYIQYLAWGNRESYPTYIKAGYKLWFRWLWEMKWREPQIKEAKRNHGSRQKRAKRGQGLGRNNG